MPLAVAAIVIGLGGPALAATPIAPDQSFFGRVNGNPTDAGVMVVCAGPIWPGRTGPAISGQTVSASLSPSPTGPGYESGTIRGRPTRRDRRGRSCA